MTIAPEGSGAFFVFAQRLGCSPSKCIEPSFGCGLPIPVRSVPGLTHVDKNAELSRSSAAAGTGYGFHLLHLEIRQLHDGDDVTSIESGAVTLEPRPVSPV